MAAERPMQPAKSRRNTSRIAEWSLEAVREANENLFIHRYI